MADENVPTQQPAPEDPGVDPGETTTSDQTPSHNASTSAMPAAGTTLDGTAPDLVQAGPSRAVPPPATGTAPEPARPRESIGARTVRLANDPEYMEQLRSIDPRDHAYMVAVRDGRTSDPRSLNLGYVIRPSAPTPAVAGPSMNGTMNGTTNGTPPRTLNGPTPETRREVDRPTLPPNTVAELGRSTGGLTHRFNTGVAGTGSGRANDDDDDEEEAAED